MKYVSSRSLHTEGDWFLWHRRGLVPVMQNVTGPFDTEGTCPSDIEGDWFLWQKGTGPCDAEGDWSLWCGRWLVPVTQKGTRLCDTEGDWSLWCGWGLVALMKKAERKTLNAVWMDQEFPSLSNAAYTQLEWQCLRSLPSYFAFCINCGPEDHRTLFALLAPMQEIHASCR
jgi:hypothetical protein